MCKLNYIKIASVFIAILIVWSDHIISNESNIREETNELFQGKIDGENVGRVYHEHTGELQFVCCIQSYYLIPLLFERQIVSVRFTSGERFHIAGYEWCPWWEDSLGNMGVRRLESLAHTLARVGNAHSYMPYDGIRCRSSNEDGAHTNEEVKELIMWYLKER